MPLPTCRIDWRALSAVIDGDDPDREPDAVPLAHLSVKFTPGLARIVTTSPPETVFLHPIEWKTNEDGHLVSPDGQRGLYLVASDIDPENIWTWTVRISSTPTSPHQITAVSYSFVAPSGGIIDLSTVIPVPAVPARDLPAWQEAVSTTTAARDETLVARDETVSTTTAARDETLVARDETLDARDDIVVSLTGEDSAVAHLVRTPSETARALDLRASGTLSAYPYMGRVRGSFRVLWHHGPTLYGQDNVAGARWLRVSLDNGATWSKLGAAAIPELHILIAKASGTLIAVTTSRSVLRSTDSGATWTNTGIVFNYVTLNHLGMIEAPDGSVLYLEYGVAGGPLFRVMRSTDDGLTWSAVMTTQAGEHIQDPGHWHSVIWDKYAARLLLFQDRASPTIWQSADSGATWTVVGHSTQEWMPNWVSPMIFSDYIAWGYDSHLGGKIARIHRDDFYAGDWGRDKVEVIYEGAAKAFYGTFPLTDDIWATTTAVETIGVGVGTAATGHQTAAMLIVSDNATRVSHGLEYAFPDAWPRTILGVGQKWRFPSFKFDGYQHEGFSWAMAQMAEAASSVASIPYTVGRQMPADRLPSDAAPILPWRTPLQWRDADGARKDILSYDGTTVKLTRGTSGTGPEVRLLDTGVGIYTDGALRFDVQAEFSSLRGKPLLMSTATSPGLYFSTAAPEGVVTAAAGSLCIVNISGWEQAAVWIKHTGSAATGWEPLGRQIHAWTAPQFQDITHLLNTTGKTAGKLVLDNTTGKMLYAAGPTAAHAWRDTMGTVVYTPA